MTRSAADLHRRAVDLCIEGEYGLAQRVLDDAEARTDDSDLRARIAGTRAVALQKTGQPARAEELLRATLAQNGLTAHTHAILVGQLGAIANLVGRNDEADGLLSRAIDELDSADDVAAARTRMNRSLVRMQQRRISEASDDVARAAETFADHDMRVDEAQARHNLGYASLLSGDLVGALREMLAARPGVASSAVNETVADMDRAEVLRDAGLTTEAEHILARAASVFGAHRMPQSRAEAEFHLARSLLLRDPARARKIAGAAVRRFGSLGIDAWAARAEAVRLRAALRQAAAQPGARLPSTAQVDTVSADLERAGYRGEAVALRLTDALARTERGSSPTRPVRLPRPAPLEVQLLSAQLKASRSRAAGRGGEARRHAAAGLDVLAGWQRSFGSLDLQTSIAMHGTGLIFAGLESAVRSGRPDVIFEWSERARHLSQQVVPLRPPPDPELARELAELRMLRAEHAGQDWLSLPRAAQLRESARQRQWSATGGAADEALIDLDHLAEQLGDEDALVSYVNSGTDIVALACRGADARVVAITSTANVRRLLAGLRSDLDVAASVRSGPIADVVRRSLDDRMTALSDTLLTPLLPFVGDRRLVIAVPGVLNSIPWAMLPALEGRAFTIAVSATRWAAMRHRPVARRSAGFAVGPRVSRGEEEVTTAAARWPGHTSLSGAAASVDAVTELASAVDVLHIAAHGRHAVDNPMFSGIELADGTLFGYDVDLMPDVPDTVVLSACEVGRSSVRWGEEAVGMTRVWLHAGTRCVIAAPVIVADDEACELLGRMHQGLAAGEEPAVALAEAARHTGIRAPFQAHGAGF